MLRGIDNGIGMATEDCKRIFDRFYRADSARTGDIHGSGLGLSLAKWIVDEHNGQMEVESVLGCGSEFAVTLPAAI